MKKKKVSANIPVDLLSRITVYNTEHPDHLIAAGKLCEIVLEAALASNIKHFDISRTKDNETAVVFVSPGIWRRNKPAATPAKP